MSPKRKLEYWELQIQRNYRRMIVDRIILAVVAGVLSGLLIYVVIGAAKDMGYVIPGL